MTEVFYTRTDMDEHLIGHALARYALERISNKSCGLILTPDHKPRSTDPELHLSISHSGGVCAAAVSSSPIGLDIELSNREPNRLLKLSERFFSPDEYDYVKLDPELRFYEIWCKKESYVKFTGEGFSRPFKAFSVFKLTESFSPFDIFGHFGCICSHEQCSISLIFVQYAEFAQYL